MKQSNLKKIVMFWLLSAWDYYLNISFCSQQNLRIANLKPNRTALSSEHGGLADSRRGKEGVLSRKPELGFCAGTMPWLEQSHPSTFLPFWGGPCPVFLRVISLCHLLGCYLQCSNSWVQMHRLCRAVTVSSVRPTEIPQWWSGTADKEELFLLEYCLLVLLLRWALRIKNSLCFTGFLCGSGLL